MTEIVYIDNPFAIDEVVSQTPIRLWLEQPYDHGTHLKYKLRYNKHELSIIDKITTIKKFDAIFEKVELNSAVANFEIHQQVLKEEKRGDREPLQIKNLSTGIKTFLIIKTLLTNGTIEQNGTIILDEPEIHLHPEWQLLFAELIVLIQKEFGMHILINTHSPYFLRAIQVFSARHEIADKCRYYMSELKNDTAYIKDVTTDIEQIYQKLSAPFQKLDDVRWEDVNV